MFRLTIILTALSFLTAQGRIPNYERKYSDLFIQNETPKQDRKEIVNGDEAVPGRYPYAARLTGADGGFCGGTLIHPEWVLTAAHCYADDLERVTIGRHDFGSDNETSDEDYDDIEVDFFVIHPGYDNFTDQFDIGLIKLMEPSRFPTIHLDLNATDLTGDSSFIIMGWGDIVEDGNSSDVLLEAEVDIIPKEECEEKYDYNLTADMICAGSFEIDTCHGDSGGPLILEGSSFEEDIQIGVTSFGKFCGNGTFPSVYSYVSETLDFISSVMLNETFRI